MPEEEIDVSTTSISDQVELLMEELPPAIQNFLRSPERDAVSLRLSQKHSLHADAAGAFERAYIFMLLGVYSPDEFVGALREGGIDDATIRSLTADVNDQVFKKLRDEERVGPATPEPPRRPSPAVPPMAVGEGMEPPKPPAASTPAEPVPQRPHQPMPPPVAAPTPAPAPLPTPPVPVYTPAPASAPIYMNVPVPTYPHARTMAGDMQLASQGLEGQAASPARSFQTASVPVTYAPPPPPAPQSQPAPTYPESAYAPPALAPVRLTPIDRTYENTPITKEYGSDPYREAIE
ncbi:MAG TPA: hypothetical protein VGB97_04040 [Candidatus Paceibacterota bacterium]